MSPAEERTEEATPRRRAQSLEQGVKAHSAAAASAFAVAAFIMPALSMVVYLAAWPDAFRIAARAAATVARLAGVEVLVSAGITMREGHYWQVLTLAWAGAVGAAAAAALACGSLGFAPAAILPKIARSSSRASLLRLASTDNLLQAAHSGVAVALITMVSIPLFLQAVRPLAQAQDIMAQSGAAASMFVSLWWRAVIVLATVAILDVMLQRRRHAARLRMSPRELREERAKTEGRPETKQRRRAVGARRARNLRIAAIRRATAVITNPTHLAVALRYSPPSIDVPTVVARGADLMAPVVRSAARTFGVPIVESPELARTLYLSVDVDQPIPEECYAAVAAIFSWIIRTHGRLRRGDEEES
ncbi:MAG: EscU/YscU/HrcU family type III secretion system export apparatus switch protein [Candidatus Eremiobacteraeota bacterium]|nr:EscU/YscU/HrcU family type III secretion system export apparatus switch protein [Candidatus Eremiobacteraeota bacterium]